MTYRLPLALAAVVALAACSRDAKPADPGLSQDLALANQVQQQTPPTLQDTAIAPKPVEKPRSAPQRLPQNPTVRTVPPPTPPPVAPPPMPSAPIRPTPAPEPVVTAPANGGGYGAGTGSTAREIGAGTGMTASTGAKVCTSTNRPGDKLVASLSAPVTGSNGAVIPAGSTVVLEIASVTPGDTPNNASITFRVRSIVVNNTSYPVTGDVTPLGTFEQVKIPNAAGSDTKKVVGGAIAGALIGRIIGGSTKGAVIGAAGGAATGAVVAKAGQKYDACLAEGTSLKVVLAEKITLGT